MKYFLRQFFFLLSIVSTVSAFPMESIEALSDVSSESRANSRSSSERESSRSSSFTSTDTRSDVSLGNEKTLVVAERVDEPKEVQAVGEISLTEYLRQQVERSLYLYFKDKLESVEIQQDDITNELMDLMSKSSLRALQNWRSTNELTEHEKNIKESTPVNLEAIIKGGLDDNSGLFKLMDDAFEKINLEEEVSKDLGEFTPTNSHRKQVIDKFNNVGRKVLPVASKEEKIKALSELIELAKKGIRDKHTQPIVEVRSLSNEETNLQQYQNPELKNINWDNQSISKIGLPVLPPRYLTHRRVASRVSKHISEKYKDMQNEYRAFNESLESAEAFKAYLTRPTSYKFYWSLFSATMTAIKGQPYITKMRYTKKELAKAFFSAAKKHAIYGVKYSMITSVGVTVGTTIIGELTRQYRTAKPTVALGYEEKEKEKNRVREAIEKICHFCNSRQSNNEGVTETSFLLNNATPNYNTDLENGNGNQVALDDIHTNEDILFSTLDVNRTLLMQAMQKMDFYTQCCPLRRIEIVKAFGEKFNGENQIADTRSQVTEIQKKALNKANALKIQSFVEEQTKKNNQMLSNAYYGICHPGVLMAGWTISNGAISAFRFQPEFKAWPFWQRFLFTWLIDIGAEWTGRYRDLTANDESILKLIEPNKDQLESSFVENPLFLSAAWSICAGLSVLARCDDRVISQGAWLSFLIAFSTNWLSEQSLKERQKPLGIPFFPRY